MARFFTILLIIILNLNVLALKEGESEDDEDLHMPVRPKVGLTLRDSMELSQNQSFRTRISETDREITLSQRGQTISRMLPQVSVSGTYARTDPKYNKLVGNSSAAPIPEFNQSLTFTATQPLSKLLQSGQMISIANKKIQIDQTLILKNRRDAQFNGADAYISAQTAGQKLDIEIATDKIAKKQEQEAKIKYDAGKIQRQEYLNFQIQHADASKAVENARRDYQIALEVLKETLGLDKESPIELPEYESTWERNEQKVVELQSFDVLLPKRQDVAMAIEKISLRQKQKGLKLMDMLIPEVSLFASYSKNFAATSVTTVSGKTYSADQVSVTVMYGLNLQWVIWDWGAKLQSMTEAAHEVQAAQIEKLEADSKGRIDISKSYLSLKASLENLKISQFSAKTATESYKVTKAKFNLGQATSLDLIIALQTLTKARASLANARGDIDRNYFALKRSLGEDLLDQIGDSQS